MKTEHGTDLILGDWDSLGAQALALRTEVFVHEQGVPPELELDEFDPISLHALLRNAQGEALATGRLLPDGHVGRLAVRTDQRGRGLGRQVLDALLARARAAGLREVVLHAQIDAEGFYTRAGFVPEGEVFIEAGIRHRTMRREVS